MIYKLYSVDLQLFILLYNSTYCQTNSLCFTTKITKKEDTKKKDILTSNSGKTRPSAVRKKYSFVGFRFHECISSWNQLQIPVKSSPWLFFAGYVYINTHTLYTTTTTTLPSRKLYNKGSAVDFTTCHYHTGGCARTPLRQAGGIRWNQAGLHGYRPNFQTPPFPHPHILPPSGASFLCIMCGIEVTGEFKVSQRPLQSNYSLYVSHWAEGVFTLSDWHNSKIEHLAVLGAIGKKPFKNPPGGPQTTNTHCRLHRVRSL